MTLPSDLDTVVENAWQRACPIPGFLLEGEFRALGLLAACAPDQGVIVEIGSFKGKSTIALASVAARYGLGPVVSIDPHTAPSITDPDLSGQLSSFDDFLATIRSAGLEQQIEAHCAFSRDVARGWNRKIRMLWIDGDHAYRGTKEDFDLFHGYLAEGAIVALHDTLNFEGPIRVFTEDILRSDEFGPAGFCHSLGWSQYRPHDGVRFRVERKRLAQRAARLIPFLTQGYKTKGLNKLRFKLNRWQVPHTGPASAERLYSILHRDR